MIATVVVLIAGAIGIWHLIELAAIAWAAREVRRQRRFVGTPLSDAAFGAGAMPGVSAVLPAGTDPGRGIAAIEALLDTRYADLEVIVVLDSGSGPLLERLSDRFDLQPADPRPRGDIPTEHVRSVFSSRRDRRVLVVDKRGTDRADAWNAGLNFATRALVLASDPGVRFEAASLTDAVLPFALDPSMMAIVATISLAENGRQTPGSIPTSVAGGLHYLRQARRSLSALALNAIDAQICATPSFSIYTRGALRQVGGFHPRTPDPGRELAIRLHALCHAAGTPDRILQSATAFARRAVGNRWADLTDAAVASHRGSMLLLGLHRRALAGAPPVARVVLPLAALELTVPVLEVAGWLVLAVGLAMGVVGGDAAVFFVAATLGLGLASSLTALLLEVVAFGALPTLTDKLRSVGLALVEQLGPRQLLLWWRLRAWFSAPAPAATV